MIITGIIFEIMGAFILALEAFGKKRVKNIVNRIDSFSRWSKKSMVNMFLATLVPMALVVLAIIIQSDILIGLVLPILILQLFQTFLIDDASSIVNWESRRKKVKIISPYGFLLLLAGNVIQVICVIWQMKLK